LKPEHLSLYCLTIEQNTAFYKLNLRGQLDLPDDECQVAMYDECVRRAGEAGYEQYEISNFAQPDRHCRHNVCYWNAEEYAGYGPGAVGSVETDTGRVRYTNLKHPEAYCQAISSGGKLQFETETIDEPILRTERIMLGLRMNAGLMIDGLDLPETALNKLKSRGWIEFDSDRIRLTPAGRHFCSEVALELI
jgi:oxygen-independent coproporphyrinogen-3 oxidase